jgi:hypothetical protein
MVILLFRQTQLAEYKQFILLLAELYSKDDERR